MPLKQQLFLFEPPYQITSYSFDHVWTSNIVRTHGGVTGRRHRHRLFVVILTARLICFDSAAFQR